MVDAAADGAVAQESPDAEEPAAVDTPSDVEAVEVAEAPSQEPVTDAEDQGGKS